MDEIYKKLCEPFPESAISWRLGATKGDKTKGIALAYVDSRAVMERLDSVVGWDNWQCRYPYAGCCELSIRVNNEWITKTNAAGKTQVEAEKGEASDAFKRAAVLFGVGRYLYYLPNTWVDIEPAGRSYKIKSTPNLPKWALPDLSDIKKEADKKPEDNSKYGPGGEDDLGTENKTDSFDF